MELSCQFNGQAKLGAGEKKIEKFNIKIQNVTYDNKGEIE